MRLIGGLRSPPPWQPPRPRNAASWFPSSTGCRVMSRSCPGSWRSAYRSSWPWPNLVAMPARSCRIFTPRSPKESEADRRADPKAALRARKASGAKLGNPRRTLHLRAQSARRFRFLRPTSLWLPCSRFSGRNQKTSEMMTRTGLRVNCLARSIGVTVSPSIK